MSLLLGRGDRPVLDRVFFEIGQGEARGIIGRSGAGTSTLARILTGLEPPTAGEVRIDGATLSQCGADRLGPAPGGAVLRRHRGREHRPDGRGARRCPPRGRPEEGARARAGGRAPSGLRRLERSTLFDRAVGNAGGRETRREEVGDRRADL
ncbi:MAG: ATP-binding cassette domain-containing protein [Roseicyclus sp.]